MGKETNEFGEVIAVGPGKHTTFRGIFKPTIKVGDKLYYQLWVLLNYNLMVKNIMLVLKIKY